MPRLGLRGAFLLVPAGPLGCMGPAALDVAVPYRARTAAVRAAHAGTFEARARGKLGGRGTCTLYGTQILACTGSYAYIGWASAVHRPPDCQRAKDCGGLGILFCAGGPRGTGRPGAGWAIPGSWAANGYINQLSDRTAAARREGCMTTGGRNFSGDSPACLIGREISGEG